MTCPASPYYIYSWIGDQKTFPHEEAREIAARMTRTLAMIYDFLNQEAAEDSELE